MCFTHFGYVALVLLSHNRPSAFNKTNNQTVFSRGENLESAMRAEETNPVRCWRSLAVEDRGSKCIENEAVVVIKFIMGPIRCNTLAQKLAVVDVWPHRQ